MPTLGERLRGQRQSQGIALEAISAQTKITTRYLAALEKDDWSQLPGQALARSFARQFADAIGLESEIVESELEKLSQPISEDRSIQPARPGSDLPPIPDAVGIHRASAMRRFVAPVAWLVGMVVLCSAAYSVWLRWRPAPPRDIVAAVRPAALPTVKPAKTEPPPPAPEPAPEPRPADPAPAGAGVVVEIRANKTVWVMLSADGKRIFTGNLDASQSRRLQASEVVRLRTGNAAATEMTWNGNEIGPAGPEGHVRTVVFHRDRYEVLPPRTRTGEEGPTPPATPDPFAN